MMSYELLAFHLITTKIIAVNSIPLLLAFATGSGVIANLVLGKLYDRFELPTVLCAVFLSALFSPLIFFGGFYGTLVGVVLLGIAYATEDTLITAMIAGVLPEGKRSFSQYERKYFPLCAALLSSRRDGVGYAFRATASEISASTLDMMSKAYPVW